MTVTQLINYIQLKYSVIHLEDFSDYYSKPITNLYKTLKNCYRSEFKDNERIVFYDQTVGNEYAYYHLQKVLATLDIPNFFVLIISNNKEVATWLDIAREKYTEDSVIQSMLFNDLTIDKTITTNFNIPDTICVTPWINVEVNNNGNFNFCCEARLTNSPALGYNIVNTSFDKFTKGTALTNIRKQFMLGSKPTECSLCFEKEEKGNRSKRIRDNYAYRNIINDIDWNDSNTKLVVLDIKLGYLCNLACRICSPNQSSAWKTEIQKNHAEFNYVNLEKNSADWTSDKESNFWKQLQEVAIDVQYITFAGGEPLLTNTHLGILQHFIDHGIANNINLHYNTNGTIFPKNAIAIWNQFKTVEISFSLDNLNEKFDYERYGSTWDNVYNNLLKFLKLGSLYTFNIYCTLSAINVSDAYEMYMFGKSIGMNVEYNILHEPKEFDIRILSPSAKNFIIQKFQNVNDIEFTKNIQVAFSLLHETTTTPIDMFFKNIERMDKIRKQKFSDVYPNLYGLLCQ